MDQPLVVCSTRFHDSIDIDEVRIDDLEGLSVVLGRVTNGGKIYDNVRFDDRLLERLAGIRYADTMKRQPMIFEMRFNLTNFNIKSFNLYAFSAQQAIQQMAPNKSATPQNEDSFQSAFRVHQARPIPLIRLTWKAHTILTGKNQRDCEKQPGERCQ
jgi:hypothetical protein